MQKTKNSFVSGMRDQRDTFHARLHFHPATCNWSYAQRLQCKVKEAVRQKCICCCYSLGSKLVHKISSSLITAFASVYVAAFVGLLWQVQGFWV